MIDLVTLKDFLVLCQVKSFSRAALRCHLSVSGLSRRILGLEQWLGAAVFDRHKSSVELTDAGRRLQAIGTEVVYALEGLRKSIQEDDADKQVRIRFSAPHIMSTIFFSDWIPRLHSDLKGAKFSVTSDNLPECLATLNEGSADYIVALFDQADVVTTRLGIDLDGPDYLIRQLGQESLVPVCAPNAAGQPRFNLAGHAAGPISLLGYAAECHLGWSLQPMLDAHASLQLEQHHEASLTDGLRFMALSGFGVAWLPQSLVREDLAARRLVRAGDQRFDVPLRLMLVRRRRQLASLAEHLWVHLAELAGEVEMPDMPIRVVA